MNERYSYLYTLPQNLYTVGSPVLISAGTLLKDNQNGRIIAQLKFRSISNKIIKAVKVKLNLFDTAGNPIGESVVYDYLDLSVSRNVEFGQKTPVPVSDNIARSYSVAVTEVVFGDRSVWTEADGKWEPLSKPQRLLLDDELFKQYQITFGNNSKYEPKEEKDLWYCTCGELNRKGEMCHACRNTLTVLQTVDMAQLAKEKDARLANEAQQAAIEQAAAEKQKKILKIIIPAVCAVIVSVVLLNMVILPTAKYNNAMALMENNQYEEAITVFETLNGYKDSVQKIEICETAILECQYNAAVALKNAGKYEEAAAAFAALDGYRDSISQIERVHLMAQYDVAVSLAENGKNGEAAIIFAELGGYQDAAKRSAECWNTVLNRTTISANKNHVVAIKSNGTALAVGFNYDTRLNVDTWQDIVDISAGYNHTVGLKSDGTVVAVGVNEYGQCDVENWSNIVDVSAGGGMTIGLKSNGTVVSVGSYTDGRLNGIGTWQDIVGIDAANFFVVGLKSDGTVVSNAKYDVSGWRDIVAVSAKDFNIVGLKSDGTVVAVGNNKYGQLDVTNWQDIVSISAGYGHIVALKSDGTVVAVGNNKCGQCDVSSWTDIASISAGDCYTVGLKSDGTVVYAGSDYLYGQRDAAGWNDIKLP